MNTAYLTLRIDTADPKVLEEIVKLIQQTVALCDTTSKVIDLTVTQRKNDAR